MGFRDQGIEPAEGFSADGFIVRPLAASDAVLDHDAVMASREFLFHWEQDPPYPPADFSVDDNRSDLEWMTDNHRDGARYTYTVMNAEQSQVLGCIYLIAGDDPMFQSAEVTTRDGTDLTTADAAVSFWVRPALWDSGFEHTLLDALVRWLRSDVWSLERPVIITNEHLDHQIATIESLGLTRRFDYDRSKDMYTSFAYA